MTDIDGTDYCTHCRRVTHNRVERGMGRTAFVCVTCGRETDHCFDELPDDDYAEDLTDEFEELSDMGEFDED